MAEAWKVGGTYFESCNCAAACPCVFLSAPTEGQCTVLLAWHIDKGSFGRVALDGLNAALLAHSPGHMMKTKWKVALYLDESANAEQQKALGAIFSGQAGGHLAALGPLIGEVMGAKPVRIEYAAAGKTRRMRIPKLAEMEIEALEGQGGADVTIENHPFTAVPGEPAVVGTSKKLSVHDHGISLDISGRNGFYSAFAYHS
ncbi:MAG TPA: DUF1326 domain-containing protein [Usitatibacter sp.]|nr:DUF1326 domain-containing protein [Usitatibacter sp.]